VIAVIVATVVIVVITVSAGETQPG
jgi:hypothetical protein